MNNTLTLNKLIESRRSSRIFSGKKIQSSIFEIIFEAVRWTPSSRNTQPWHFLVAHNDSKAFVEILDTLSASNQTWASNASAFIVVLADRSVEYQHLEYDLGQSVAYLTFQALDFNLNIRQMAGFDALLLAQKLAINNPFQIFTVIAIGEIGDINNASVDIAKKEAMPRVRKSLEQVFTIIE